MSKYLEIIECLRKWNQTDVLNSISSTSNSSIVLEQLAHFERWYTGGLNTYLQQAQSLYDQSKNNTLTSIQGGLSNWYSSQPSQVVTDPSKYEISCFQSKVLLDLETIGLENIQNSCFIVVAGGIGERLGYNDIKLALPVEILTFTSYLETYIQYILALEKLGQRNTKIPLVLMTSEATHEKTEKYLETNQYFSMPKDQIILLKQENVPCLDLSPEGHLQLVLDKNIASSEPQLIMKPHGHGDIHKLLHESGLLEKWATIGKTHIHLFQDTNVLILNSILPMLGASIKYNWAFNYTGVWRKAKDKSGAIVQFNPPETKEHSIPLGSKFALINIEYHELERFLPHGDVNDPVTGYSTFAGNINHLVIALDSYLHALNISKGLMPEIFNPKYSSDNATRYPAFASPARLECMMQDFPRLLIETDAHNTLMGFLLFNPSMVYSPLKNDRVTGAQKFKNDIPPQCAGSAEYDLYQSNATKLEVLGIEFVSSQSAPAAKNKDEVDNLFQWNGARIIMKPSFAPCFSILKTKFPTPPQISISSHSTLIIDGDDITIYHLSLNGALKIHACDGAHVCIQSLSVQNAGVLYQSFNSNPLDNDLLSDKYTSLYEMRGYKFQELEIREFNFTEPGHYVINE